MKGLSALKTLLVSCFLLVSLIASSNDASSLDVPPEIVSTSPYDYQTDVFVFANITVVFNKEMDNSSEDWNVSPYVALIPSWSDNYTLNLNHSTPLDPATNYVVRVTANNSAGTPLRGHWYEWRFTTTCSGLCIIETSPVDGEVNVDVYTSVRTRFSGPIDTVNTSFTMVPDASPYSTIWSASDNILIIAHAKPFLSCTLYTVNITTVGLVPGPVPNPWSFTTMCPGSSFIDVAPAKGFPPTAGGSFFAWGDYNRDGNEDLLVNGKRLYRNNGPPNYDFTDVTGEAGIGNTSVNNGVWGDYNNDGWLDFYAPGGGWSTNAGPNAPWDILWMNDGDGTFTNITAAAGMVKDIYPSVAAGWGDYDNDGDVDLYVANYENAAMTGYYPDRLWRNNGDGTFIDATVAAEVLDTGPTKPGRGVAWGDYNNDGWQDIYISNYRITANYLWRNDGDGTFTDVAPATNTTGYFQTTNLCPDAFLGGLWGKQWGHTIGSAWADFDNDGDLDIFTANLVHKYVGNTTWPQLPYDMRGYITDDSRFFRNEGAPNYDFTDIREASGMPYKPIWTRDWGMVDNPLAPCVRTGPVPGLVGDELFGNVMWTDYDLDGYQDMWLTQVYDLDYSYSYLYHNNGDGTFYDVTSAANVKVWNAGYAGAWADYNNDGWPDLVTSGKYPLMTSPSRLLLFENQGGNSSWLKVKLNGCTSNAAAIGGRILATANGMTQMRNVEAGSGSHSQMNSLAQQFGFGAYSGNVDLDVRWPNNNTQTFTGVGVNQTLLLQEPGCDTPNRVEFVSADIPGGSDSDVVVEWVKAMGDDPVVSNVTGYAVYYGTIYDPSATSYKYLGDVPAGITTYTHAGAGIGDMNTYYYAVQTNGTGGAIRSLAQAVKFSKHLLLGEQLVSIPVPVRNYSLESVLRGVAFDHVRIYDGALPDPWLSYMPGRLYNDFQRFTHYQAFWIGVTSDSYLTVAGPILNATTISLRAGWNLVGYPSTLPRTVAEAIAGLGSNLKSMEGYDSTAVHYYLKRMMPTDMMNGGDGFWILVGSTANWYLTFQP